MSKSEGNSEPGEAPAGIDLTEILQHAETVRRVLAVLKSAGRMPAGGAMTLGTIKAEIDGRHYRWTMGTLEALD